MKVDQALVEFESVALRLKAAIGAGSDAELARILGLSATAYTCRKQRRMLPLSRIAKVCLERGISIDRILNETYTLALIGDEKIAKSGEKQEKRRE
ncbi:MAG: hypothetical protein LBO72_07275 [Helicobacteraceae bacterium]|jgi:hypothetical protein|nr:hypothetical protein [Helicobacteraceae bacterium]